MKQSPTQPIFDLTAKPNLLKVKDNFGKDARQVYISPKYPSPMPKDNVPGPGAYTPKEHDIKLRCTFPRAMYEFVEEPITSNIQLYRPPGLESINKRQIHGRITFEPKRDNVPSPFDYQIPTTFTKKKSHTISATSTEFVVPKSQTPPPGTYNPVDPMILKAPAYTFQKTFKRNLVTDYEKTPAPGRYSPIDATVQHKAPSWTIGGKSRVGKRALTSLQRKSDILIIDKVSVFLSKTGDAAAAKKYYTQHQELRTFVAFLFDMILEDKPNDPIAYIRNYFQQLLETDEFAYLRGAQPEESSDDDLSDF